MTMACAHDLTHSEDRHVMAVRWYHWFTDGFKLVMWVLSAVVVFPIGLIATFFGFPKVYASMYDGVVSGWLKLAAY